MGQGNGKVVAGWMDGRSPGNWGDGGGGVSPPLLQPPPGPSIHESAFHEWGRATTKTTKQAWARGQGKKKKEKKSGWPLWNWKRGSCREKQKHFFPIGRPRPGPPLSAGSLPSPIIHSSAQLSLSSTTFTSGWPKMSSLQVKKEKLEPAEQKQANKVKAGNEEEKKIKIEPTDSQKEVVDNPPVKQLNSSATSRPRPQQCRCLIDLSSPAALERDFYAWLNGLEPVSDTTRPCLFNGAHSPPPPFPPPIMPLLPSDRLSMLSLTEYHVNTVAGHYAELPAFLAPSDSASSASSLSSSASASSSSISPGGTAHCCSFSSSADSSAGLASSCSYPIGLANQQPFHPPPQMRPMPNQAMATFHKATVGNEGRPGNGMRMRRKRNVDKASGRGTNLYGRSYCPGRPLSMEERAQIIHLFHGGMKVNAISKQLCISHGCVSKIITRFRETGNLMPSSHSECRRRKRLQQQQIQQQQEQQLGMEKQQRFG